MIDYNTRRLSSLIRQKVQPPPPAAFPAKLVALLLIGGAIFVGTRDELGDATVVRVPATMANAKDVSVAPVLGR